VNLRQAEEYLLSLELFGMRFGVDRMHKLMTALGMPQRRFASIHVVGTNGKSSTVRMTAAILERHGLSTGTYTSPHLRSFRERIEVRERPIAEHDFAATVTRAARAAELVDRTLPPDDRVTQFEALTAAAYHELARRGVEVAVIEAGLGGRYDATNVIPSKVQVLTGVSLEHARWLGPTITHIAEEKLAVVRDHGVLVTPELHPEAEAVAGRTAVARRARRVRAGSDPGVPVAAPGAFQRRNFALAAAAAGAFLLPGAAPAGPPVGGEALVGLLDPGALRRAAAETRVPGRLDVVAERPLTVLDGAHNPDGARALAESLPEVLAARRPVVGVLAVLDDKDAAGMLEALLPCLDRAVFTRSRNPRSLPPATLETLAAKLGGPGGETVSEPHAAVERAHALAGPEGAVVATGSIYLVADLVRERGQARASVL
jgi:dihydrofolate synthase / folylpolyglutamate synthase